MAQFCPPAKLIIRIRSPKGQSRIDTLTMDQTLNDLQVEIAERTGIPVEGQVRVDARPIWLPGGRGHRGGGSTQDCVGQDSAVVLGTQFGGAARADVLVMAKLPRLHGDSQFCARHIEQHA